MPKTAKRYIRNEIDRQRLLIDRSLRPVEQEIKTLRDYLDGKDETKTDAYDDGSLDSWCDGSLAMKLIEIVRALNTIHAYQYALQEFEDE